MPDSLPLVLHGASGLDRSLLRECMSRGVCKFNVNTDLRKAAVAATRGILMQSNQVSKLMYILHTTYILGQLRNSAHVCIHSFMRAFIHSFIHSYIESLLVVYWQVDLLDVMKNSTDAMASVAADKINSFQY